MIFTILNAVAVNLPMLIAFRFFAGFAGVGAITIGTGKIGDLIPPERRGMSMALYSMGPIFGPIVVSEVPYHLFWILSLTFYRDPLLVAS